MIGDTKKLVAGVILSIALAVSLAATAHIPQVVCTPSVEGTVSAINLSNATLILRTDSSGTLTVLVRRSTILTVRETDATRPEHQLEFSEIRVGDRVVVHGTCLDERSLLAFTLTATQTVSDAATDLDHFVAVSGGASGSAGLTSTAAALTLTMQTSITTASVSAATSVAASSTIPSPQTTTGGSIAAALASAAPTASTTISVVANQLVTGAVEEASARPGWGYGDENHKHSGPPGIGAAANQPSSETVEEDRAKPGWGYVDKNHRHSGPPGITDRI